MRITKNWTTYVPTLIRAVQSTEKPVLELGSGVFSTPLLHWLCEESGRKLVTYESVRDYYNIAERYKSNTHEIRFVENWDDMDLSGEWGVVLVDHVTDRRVIDALRVKDTADYIVLHDTEHSSYGYDKLWPSFKYIYHWTFCKPWTSVVSNKHDFILL